MTTANGTMIINDPTTIPNVFPIVPICVHPEPAQPTVSANRQYYTSIKLYEKKFTL